MCPPVIAAATSALAIGGEVMNYVGQNQLYHANMTAANLNYAQAKETADQKYVQLDQAKSENAVDTAITAAQAGGAIAASASDQGLGNQSIVGAINAAQFGIGRQATTEDINDSNARQQVSRDLTGAEINRQSQIAQHPHGSPIALALGIGKGILSGYNAGMAAK